MKKNPSKVHYNKEELTGVFKEIEEHTYTGDKCFLCGCLLTDKNRTVEHVIPRWLQHEFNLWNQTLTLLNKTQIPYRNLTIPCCKKCNNEHLSAFEKKVFDAYKGGFESFQQLDQETIFLWTGKIYFGLMYRELFLSIDRKDPAKGTITTPEYMQSFYSHLLFLQGIRKKLQFKDFFPASIFIFHCQVPGDMKRRWDLMDSHNTLFISIRMGEIGLIVVLQDGGATFQLNHILDQHRDIRLHPLQFRELSAKILYKRFIMNRTPKFMHVQHNDEVVTHMLSLQGLSSKPIYDDWSNDEYAHVLSALTEIPVEECQPYPGQVYTWLKDDEGKSRFIDADEIIY